MELALFKACGCSREFRPARRRWRKTRRRRGHASSLGIGCGKLLNACASRNGSTPASQAGTFKGRCGRIRWTAFAGCGS